MICINKMFSRFFSKKTIKRQRPITFSEDYKKGYNQAWVQNIKDYWP